MAAELTLAEAQELISGHEHEVAIAAANSHRSMVLSGDPEVLTELVGVLEQRSRFCRWIKVDVASHSPQMDALRSDLKAALAGLAPTAASIPMYSTVTGDVVASRARRRVLGGEPLLAGALFGGDPAAARSGS